MYEICAKSFLEGTFMCAPSIPVCARLMTCVQSTAHAQFRGNIDVWFWSKLMTIL